MQSRSAGRCFLVARGDPFRSGLRRAVAQGAAAPYNFPKQRPCLLAQGPWEKETGSWTTVSGFCGGRARALGSGTPGRTPPPPPPPPVGAGLFPPPAEPPPPGGGGGPTLSKPFPATCTQADRLGIGGALEPDTLCKVPIVFRDFTPFQCRTLFRLFVPPSSPPLDHADNIMSQPRLGCGSGSSSSPESKHRG